MPDKGHKRTMAFAFAFLLPVCAASNEMEPRDSLPHGWRMMPAPIVNYNSDLGFGLGALVDIYDYGKEQSVFPGYLHRIHIGTCYHFGGRSMVHGEYDSDHLIPGARFSVSLIWQKDPLYNFYGFGGDVVTYDSSIDRRNGLAYYSHYRETVNFTTSFLFRTSCPLNIDAGLSFWYYDTADTRYRQYDGTFSLYHFYRQTGVILDNETKGSRLELKAGLNWDTRNSATSPSRGICADLNINAAPDFFGTGYSYIRLCAHFRHYISPGPDWLTLAYHLAYQGVIAGTAPFYMLQNIYPLASEQTYDEGLGGQNTLRGIMAGRLIGNGYVWSNMEVRIRLFRFRWLGQEFHIGTNPFLDMGAIVQPYKIKEMAAAMGESEEELYRRSGRLHACAGAGLQFGMNGDCLISVEAGKSFNRNDGPVGIYIAINYIF